MLHCKQKFSKLCRNGLTKYNWLLFFNWSNAYDLITLTPYLSHLSHLPFRNLIEEQEKCKESISVINVDDLQTAAELLNDLELVSWMLFSPHLLRQVELFIITLMSFLLSSYSYRNASICRLLKKSMERVWKVCKNHFIITKWPFTKHNSMRRTIHERKRAEEWFINQYVKCPPCSSRKCFSNYRKLYLAWPPRLRIVGMMLWIFTPFSYAYYLMNSGSYGVCSLFQSLHDGRNGFYFQVFNHVIFDSPIK